MWVAAKFDCPTNRLEPCQGDIASCNFDLPHSPENTTGKYLCNNLTDHNKDYSEADDNVHLVDVAVHSDRLSSIMNQ